MPDVPPAEPSTMGAEQFRLRDLMLVTLALCVLLAIGRAVGGGVSVGEVALLVVSLISIGAAAVFLTHRWVWGACLAASFALAAVFVPAPAAWRTATGALTAAHFLFAGLPILAVDPRHPRWPWVAAAVGVQLAAALFTPPDAIRMIGVGATFSFGLAYGVIVWRYRLLRARRRPPSEAFQRPSTHAPPPE